MTYHIGGTTQLLRGDDVAPVHEVNVEGRSPFLLTSDHYGRLLPEQLGNLGLTAEELTQHIAWDVGIAGVVERLAVALDAHLIAQRYSRLVIDCNRPPGAAGSIPVISEATVIPGNDGISADERDARRREIFDPYHHCISAAIDRRMHAHHPTVLVALHSFTPVYAGATRPWHIGALYRQERRQEKQQEQERRRDKRHDAILPRLLLQHLRAEGDLVVGDNKPYAVSDATDYTIPVHGEARGLINTGIEIRQDLIADQSGQQQWAKRLARILAKIEMTLRDEGLVS
jgi:predicted N-formylglutamate amidohydrolase